MKRIGTRLREEREAAGLSQREVGRSSGGAITPAGLSRIEKGDRYPTLRTLEGLTRALPVRVIVESGRVKVEVTS